MMKARGTQLWADAVGIPEALRATLRGSSGFADVASVIGAAQVSRIVVTGNGAAYHAALAMWLASVDPSTAGGRSEILAVPAGLLLAGRFAWRPGDRLLAISASGRLRDVIDVLGSVPRPFSLITSSPHSPLAQAADAVALVNVHRQEAVTHTQAYVGNVAAALSVLASIRADRALSRAVTAAPALLEEALREAEATLDGADSQMLPHPHAAVSFGTGPAWAAAMQAGLILKEVAGIPCEGMETREAATTGMYALSSNHLVLGLTTPDDPLANEAAEICRERGARVQALPIACGDDLRLSPMTSIPSMLALAITLGLRAGLNIDQPAWKATYEGTARSQPHGSSRQPGSPYTP